MPEIKTTSSRYLHTDWKVNSLHYTHSDMDNTPSVRPSALMGAILFLMIPGLLILGGAPISK